MAAQTQPAPPGKLETFEVVICSKRTGEIIAITHGTLETQQGPALLECCEARIVPAGKKYRVGDKLDLGG